MWNALFRKSRTLRLFVHWIVLIGLYRHWKGSYYIVLGWVWEATNNQRRESKILYLSLWPLQFNVREESEFKLERFSIETLQSKGFRFKKIFPTLR